MLEKNGPAHAPARAGANAAPPVHKVTRSSSSSRSRPQADLVCAGTVILNVVGRVPSIDSQ
jgi:hypothetical protein